MIWLRRCVVWCLGCTVGLLLYWAWRVREGGATASLLCGAAVACKLGCTEITNFTAEPASQTQRSWRVLAFSILPRLVSRCTSAAELSMSSSIHPQHRPRPAPSGKAGGVDGVGAPIPFTSKLDDMRHHARDV